MRATCPVPRGVRRDRRGGESPGEDVARSVSVRVIRVATFDAAEEGLALAVLPCDMTADAALLRSETRIGIDHLRPGRCGLLLRAPGQGTPCGGEDAPAQASLGAGPVRQERAVNPRHGQSSTLCGWIPAPFWRNGDRAVPQVERRIVVVGDSGAQPSMYSII